MKQQDKLLSKEVRQAIEILGRGGVVIFPTDTVYGVGCRADMPQSIQRIKNIKRTNQNFPILISSVNQAHHLAIMGAAAIHLATLHWPGPLTILVTSKTKEEKIGLRIPDSDLVRTIIEKVGVPIIGTSANFHHQPSVADSKDLDPALVKLVDFVIKGKCNKKVESTIVDTTVSPVKILREGAVKVT